MLNRLKISKKIHYFFNKINLRGGDFLLCKSLLIGGLMFKTFKTFPLIVLSLFAVNLIFVSNLEAKKNKKEKQYLKRLNKIESKIKKGVRQDLITKEEKKDLLADAKELRREIKDSGNGQKRNEQIKKDLDNLAVDTYVEKMDAQSDLSRRELRQYKRNVRENRNDAYEEGIESGLVTNWEEKAVNKKKAKIARMSTRFNADGEITKRERKKLQRSKAREARYERKVLNNQFIDEDVLADYYDEHH